MSDETIAVGFVEDNGGTNKLIQAVNRLADAADKLVSAENKAERATESQGKAARKASSDNDLLSRSMGGATSAASAFGGILGTLTAGFGLAKIVGYAESYTNLQNKLRLVTPDQKAMNAAIDASFAIAQRTYAPLAATGELYGKMSQTLKAVGKDTKDAGKLTEAFTASLALSGATTQQVQSATLQWTQAMGQNNVQMEEFGQLIDSAPGLIDALASGMKNGIGITRAELINLAKTGQLTRNMLVEALGQAAPRIAAAMAQVVPSISQAWNNIENSVMMYIGKSNEANSVTGRVAQGMLLLANNMNIVAPAVLALGAALAAVAAVQIGAMIAGLITSMISLATAVAMGALALGTTFLIPLGVVAAALLVLMGALSATGTTLAQFIAMLPGGQAVLDAWNKVVDFGKKKADELHKSLNDVKNAMSGAGKAAKDAAGGKTELEKATKKAEDAAKKEKEANEKLREAYSKLADASAKLFDQTLQTGVSAMEAGRSFDYFSSVLMNNYSPEAAAAAQITATLKENMYGAGSAAAMSADNYNKAASAAGNYASAAKDAARQTESLASGFGNKSATDVYGGTGIELGSFDNVTEQFTPTFKGAAVGPTKTYQLSNFGYGMDGNSYQTYQQAKELRAAQIRQKKIDEFAAANPSLTYEVAYAMADQWIRANPNSLQGYARGGGFKVGGNGGTDSQLVQFWASPNEHVDISTPAQRKSREQDNEPTQGRRGRSGVYIGSFSVVTKDNDSFRQTRRQTLRDTAREITKAVG